jgi:predicted ABC-class ATPase
VLFIREIDLEKSERILAILSDKEVSRTQLVNLFTRNHEISAEVVVVALLNNGLVYPRKCGDCVEAVTEAEKYGANKHERLQ